MTDKTASPYEPSAKEIDLADSMDGEIKYVSIELPRFSEVKIGRADQSIQVDLSRYPLGMLSRTFEYGIKRRYNDHQSKWDKKTWVEEIRERKPGTDGEYHTFLLDTATGLRDNTYAGIWAEGGGGGLPRGVREMRIEILATFKKRNVTLKLKVADVRQLSHADGFAKVLVTAINAEKKEPLADEKLDEIISAVVVQWKTSVDKVLAVANTQGDVEISF